MFNAKKEEDGAGLRVYLTQTRSGKVQLDCKAKQKQNRNFQMVLQMGNWSAG